jgi:hypothetical protein
MIWPRLFSLLLAGLVSVSPAWSQEPAAPDTLDQGSVSRAVREDRWGPLPAREPATSVRLQRTPTPPWEKVINVPYFVVGLPFRLVDFGVHQSIAAADRFGFFDLPPAEHMGLRLPGDFYLMPEFGMSGMEGTTYGLNLNRFDLWGPGNRFYLEAWRSTRRDKKISAGGLFHLTSRAELQVGAGTRAMPQTEYFGLGPESLEENEAYYHRGSSWAGLETAYHLDDHLTLEIQTNYTAVKSRSSRYEVDEALATIFAENLPSGFPGKSEGWTWRLGFEHHDAPQTGRPETGGLRRASLGWFQNSDESDLQFLTYSLDAEQFFPLWHTKRTLGVRGFFNRVVTQNADQMPLARLVTFQRPDELRGFLNSRFHGLGVVGFSLEYRWPVWVEKKRDGEGLDAFLFSDSGQVFMETAEISLENFRYTGGFGLRFINSDRDFVGRFELGFSSEGTVVTFKFSQNFQYHSKTLLKGKDPSQRR